MSGSRTHWKKPATRVYDYNYNLGEHYYKPQLRHAELKSHGRATSPPKAKTFAERFAESPVYGLYGTTTGRKSSLTDDLFGRPNRSTADRFAPHGERSGTTQSEDVEFGKSRYNSNDEFGRARFSLGDRLLDAAGTGPRGPSPRPSGRGVQDHPSPRAMEDPLDDPFFFTRGKRFGREGNLTAESDFMNEDTFKSKSRRPFDTKSADDMMDEMRRDSESAASKFRSKLRAKKAQEDSAEFGSSEDANTTESRIEKIRARARARIAEAMEDDFSASAGNHFTGDDSYGFKSPKGVGFSDDFDNVGGRSGSSKTVKISKRSMKSTYDAE